MGGQTKEVKMSYLEKVFSVAAKVVDPDNPRVHHIAICHDDWCGIFKGKPCDCDPEVNVINGSEEPQNK